jgi:hypothetical protein
MPSVLLTPFIELNKPATVPLALSPGALSDVFESLELLLKILINYI